MTIRQILLTCCFIATGVLHAETTLDAVFNKLSKKPSTTVDSVKYTGTFDGKIAGFTLQSGLGDGWTSGVSLHCQNMSPKEADAIFKTFSKTKQNLEFVLELEDLRACKDTKNMLGYASYYDKENKTLHFLRVTFENEICIPSDWYQRNYYKGPDSRDKKFQLPSSIWVASLAKLNTELKYNYVFYDRFKHKIDSAYKKILPLMAEVKDNYEGMKLLERFIATCQDGHTYVYRIGPIEETYNSPFTTKLLNGRIYIDKVLSSELKNAGMTRGMEIKAINDIPVKQYADSLLRPYISASTSQWADYKIYNKYGLSKGRKDSPLNLTLSDNKKDIEINHKIGRGKRDVEDNENDNFYLKKLKGNIGLLRIPDFQSTNIAELFDENYNKILDTNALIIDLRGNEGGNSGISDYIASHFSADSIKSNSWRSPIYIPAFASWGNKREWYEGKTEYLTPPSDKKPYLKPVVILIDNGTYSAAENFIALFKGMKRAKLVGNPTGGSTGNGVRLQLNNLIAANICSKHDTAPDGTEFVGIGIVPDVLINETPEQYFLLEEDPYIKAAIELIKQ